MLNPKGQDLSLQKGKENFYVVFTCSITWAGEIRKFHVAVGRDRSMVITDEKGRSNYHLKTVRVENMFSTKKVFLKPSNVQGVDKYLDLF